MPLPRIAGSPGPDPTVQGLWIGERLGPLQELCIRSFLANGHEFDLYVYDVVGRVPEGTRLRDAAEIIPRSEIFPNPDGFGRGSYAAFSDLFRYRLLSERGGWWVDTDVVCLKPFAFEASHVFATELSAQGIATTATCVFKSPPRSEFLRYCLEVCETANRDLLTWGQIGPELLDDAIWRFDLGRYRVAVECFNPVNYFEVRQFLSPGFDFERLKHTFGVHLWNQMWASLELDSNVDAPAESLIGALRERYLNYGVNQPWQGERSGLVDR